MQLLCLAGSEEKSHPQANLEARYYNQTSLHVLTTLKEAAIRTQSKTIGVYSCSQCFMLVVSFIYRKYGVKNNRQR